MLAKIKELLNKKKTILTILTCVVAVAAYFLQIITAEVCWGVVTAALGLETLGISMEDFGKSKNTN